MVIYIIQNKITGKCYIGQTIATPRKRWLRHLYDAKLGKIHPLYDSMRKHGKENFDFAVIETHDSKDELDQAEQFWIQYLDTVKNGYNLMCGGKHHFTSIAKMQYSQSKNTRVISKETMEKLSHNMHGSNNHFYGKHHSKESKLKISSAQVGRKRPVRSKEHCEKIRQSKLGKPRPEFVKQRLRETKIKLNTLQKEELRNLYNSGEFTQKQLAEKFGVGIATICRALK